MFLPPVVTVVNFHFRFVTENHCLPRCSELAARLLAVAGLRVQVKIVSLPPSSSTRIRQPKCRYADAENIPTGGGTHLLQISTTETHVTEKAVEVLLLLLSSP